jgi:hypothetical protein
VIGVGGIRGNLGSRPLDLDLGLNVDGNDAQRVEVTAVA